MVEFDPAPDRDDSRRRWQEGKDTFDRIYEVALGTTAPTGYTTIAELADCSPNAARKHLERLAEMGIVRADRDSRPTRYERHDGYLEWQEASRIATDLTTDEIIDRVKRLEERCAAFETRFETTDPASVSVFDADDHEAIHERMTALGEWRGAIRDVRLYELARQLSQNDGRLLPA